MNSTGASQSSGSSPEISFEKGKSGSAQDGRPEKKFICCRKGFREEEKRFGTR